MSPRTGGNALEEGRERGGWFLGHFMPESAGLRSTDEVEVKWASHLRGEGRAEWAVNEAATTLSMLVRGRFRISFEDGDVLLEREGDYAIWAPGVPHTWTCEEDAVIVTVRWPSSAGDSRGTGRAQR